MKTSSVKKPSARSHVIPKSQLKVATQVIELEPFGLTAGMDKARPVMLFREKGGESVLPVWLSALDAGIAVTQNNSNHFGASPHDVALQVLDRFGVKPTECHFTELRGHQQYVEVRFPRIKKLKPVQARADHAHDRPVARHPLRRSRAAMTSWQVCWRLRRQRCQLRRP